MNDLIKHDIPALNAFRAERQKLMDAVQEAAIFARKNCRSTVINLQSNVTTTPPPMRTSSVRYWVDDVEYESLDHVIAVFKITRYIAYFRFGSDHPNHAKWVKAKKS
jgi:hypothetical protein